MSTQPGPYEPYVPQLVLDWPESVRHRHIEGTLVHVDISGFTAMSERLAQKGKVGAEEVSMVLNRTFTDLLTIAADLGGDLLKFGGDALLLLFVGAGHPVRAVRASALMRSRLRSIGKVQTPAGRVDLKMTVGVHSGTHDAFLVGATHRELIVAGPGATRTVEIEEAAAAGEIMLSPETAEHLPAGLLGDRKGPGILLGRTPQLPAYEAPHIYCQEECRVFVPTSLRPVVAAPTEGEHRRITVGFVKFQGTDDILSRLSPDRVADRLHDLIALVQSATDEFKVAFLATDIDSNGGKIIITGGVPTATGADEEGVLRAARRIVDDCHGIPLKIGVNRGEAFAGDIGAPFRRTYTVIGDAVNLAARVMGRAEPGQVLATEGVLARSATRFTTQELPPFSVKGKSEPVRAWSVGATEGRRTETAEAEIPIFGRDAELRFLADHLEKPVGLVDVSGAPGIGKSRLVRELRVRHAELRWGFSDCDQYESATPYYPFRRLLRELAGVSLDVPRPAAARRVIVQLEERAPDLLPWWPLLAAAMDLPADDTAETARIDPDNRQAKLQQTVAAFIDAVLNGPGALVVEDAQWIDDASRDLVSYLAGFAMDRSWLIVLVHRPVDQPFASPAAREVVLHPLDEASSKRLAARALADHPLLEHQLNDLVDRSAGNPLFLLELVAAVKSGQALPDNVETLVQTRIDRLGPVERRLLRYAAVAGMTFDPSVLAEAVGDDLPEARSRQAWRSLNEFLVRRSSGDLRFRQSLFRDVAYGGLSFRVRRRLHEQIGRVIQRRAADADELAAVLSLHFLQAGLHDEAWRYSRTAGLQACGKHANVAATTFYRRALEAGRSIDVNPIEIARVAESLGDVAEPAGLYDDAERGLRHAAELRKSDPAGRARVFRKLGLLRERAGKYPQALRWFTRGLALVDDASGERATIQRVELQLAYAGVRFRQSRYQEAIRWCRAAIPDAERVGDRQALAHGYYLLSVSRQRSGDRSKAGHSERALAIYEELGDLVGQAKVLNKLGVDAYYRGDWNEALRLYRRGRSAWEGAGDSIRAAMTSTNIALVLSDQGRLDEAEPLFREALREFRATNDRWMTGVTMSNLGRLATRAARFEEGRALLDEALNSLRSIGAENFALDAESRIAENMVLAGATAEGRALAERLLGSLPSAVDERHRLLHRVYAYALLLEGDLATARTEFEHGLADAREHGNDHEVALYLDVLAGFTGGTEAEQMRSQAEAVFARLGVVAVPERRAGRTVATIDLRPAASLAGGD